MSMSKWRWLGGFREFEQWGSVDMDFHARRRTANIHTVILKNPDASNLMVYHQYHESKRDMDQAMEGVKGTDYSSLQRMREQGGLYSVYHHGPRERATDGALAGIMQDHINRYAFASQYTKDKKVLDYGCGTGYGSQLLQTAAEYLGCDVDAESIEHAITNYSNYKTSFTTNTSIWAGWDVITCFEVLEHLPEQQALIENFNHILRPGGKLVLSTPQKGATPGTPWDKYMLTHKELLSLFDPDIWHVTLYYQPHYGQGIVTPGTPPADAEIQLVVATKR
jgi:2-polyprenyl-3-methyl-5-hydroxy-6-metoxy-1,4-benzoquinol methylase